MPDINIRIQGRAGRITLARPKALNALNLEMVQAIRAALQDWADDPAVSLVILDGAGDRALCAGGDIRVMAEAARRGETAPIATFFTAEYAMNLQIARFPKPYVALMDRVVMGGGVGVAAHGSVRVVTERSVLAMPETAIGFFPDVGATWLLSRKLPMGLHLGLTGTRIGAGDAILAGLADFYVPSDRLAGLAETLCTCASAAEVTTCLEAQAEAPPPAEICADRAWMDECYRHPTMELIEAALRAHEHPSAQGAATDIATKSPSSLKVTLRALREAEAMDSLDQALAQELRLALSTTAQHDFTEGVRAVLVDKDRNAAWRPASLAEVTPEMVDGYFA